MARRRPARIGRGPDTLREKTFTSAEQSVLELGGHKELRDLRLLFRYAQVDVFCEPVDRLTGRAVRGFISGIDIEVATEKFVLHPDGYDGESRKPHSTG
jgi:hypothetical protein